MKLLKITISGAVIMACFVMAMIPSVDNNCTTDDECVSECLTRCQSIEACDDCFDVLITADNYDLYEYRVSELMWKYEAY